MDEPSVRTMQVRWVSVLSSGQCLRVSKSTRLPSVYNVSCALGDSTYPGCGYVSVLLQQREHTDRKTLAY